MRHQDILIVGISFIEIIVKWNHGTNFTQNLLSFCEENAFENVICKIVQSLMYNLALG